MTKVIFPDNLRAVSRLKVRLAKKIVSTIRLAKLDFFKTKLREKNETNNLKKLIE